MDLNTVLSKGNEYVYSEIDNEVVMMNMVTGAYSAFNITGNIIWQILTEPKTLQEVIDELVLRSNVSGAQCEADVIPFIAQLLEKKILVQQ